jgi:hypothetical protein
MVYTIINDRLTKKKVSEERAKRKTGEKKKILLHSSY